MACIQEILGAAPPGWDESDQGILALAVRQLATFRDWCTFRRAQEGLQMGTNLDDLHLEVRWTKDEIEAFHINGQEIQQLVDQCVKDSFEGRKTKIEL